MPAPSTQTPAPPTPVPLTGFQAASVTFVSADDGWVLGTAGGSLALARTQDGGATWTSLTPPPTSFSSDLSSGVYGIRFANQEDGWAYGTQLWATHDGGTSWAQVALPGLSSSGVPAIQNLEAAAGSVDAVVFYPPGAGGVTIDTSAVGSDSWTMSPATVPFGAGPAASPQLVLQGSAGWLVENDRTVIGGARLQGGAWSSWTPPCSTAGGPATLAASSPQDLIAICAVGEWTSANPVEEAFVSTDGGGGFSQLATALPSDCTGSSFLASPSVGVAAVACGADLIATFNEGASWTTFYNGATDTGIVYLGFTTASQGVAIDVDEAGSGSDNLGTLLMTHDGGHSWAAITI